LETIKTSIEKLSSESEKAALAVDRIDVLNNALEEIEERIKSMQRARQWIADAETRLEELNKQAQTQARAIDAMVKGKKSGPPADLGEGAPPMQKKENVITLARQGWSVDEIAKTMKISRGEVELILEMAPRD
jgi:DNA-binding NarL/FixJ family response regulator